MTSYSRTDISTYKNKLLHSERPDHGGLHKTSRTSCVTRFIGLQSALQKVRSNEASSPHHQGTLSPVVPSLPVERNGQHTELPSSLRLTNSGKSIALSPCISPVASVEELPGMLDSSSLNSCLLPTPPQQLMAKEA